MIADGGTLLCAPCPVDGQHRAVLDLQTRIVRCADCRHLVLDMDSWRALLDLAADRRELAVELHELRAGLDLRDRASRARALRMEELYVAGRAEVTS